MNFTREQRDQNALWRSRGLIGRCSVRLESLPDPVVKKSEKAV
jgi:hypothetical protein